jgi:PBP1b-binding outer membrane lipoprotein LpoB
MRRFRLAVTLSLALFLAACSDKPLPQATSDTAVAKPANTNVTVKEEPEPVDPAVAVSLREQIKNVRAQIVEAEAESARYTGGLV